MNNNQFRKAQNKANRLCAKIDKFIESVKEENDYFFASLILKRLLNITDESDMQDILFEIETKYNVYTLKCDSLAELMRFEAFKEELEANPYQLKLIA